MHIPSLCVPVCRCRRYYHSHFADDWTATQVTGRWAALHSAASLPEGHTGWGRLGAVFSCDSMGGHTIRGWGIQIRTGYAISSQCKLVKPFCLLISICSSLNDANNTCSPGHPNVSCVSGYESDWSPCWQCQAVHPIIGHHLGRILGWAYLSAGCPLPDPSPCLWSALGCSFLTTRKGQQPFPAGMVLRPPWPTGFAFDNNAAGCQLLGVSYVPGTPPGTSHVLYMMFFWRWI